MLRFMTLAIVWNLFAGCAGYRLTPLPAEPTGPTHVSGEEGYVFYAPQPFLLGTLKEGTEIKDDSMYEYKIVYLPDYSRPYRFTRYEFFAKSDLKITFSDGWQFTGAESSTDTTAAWSAVLELAKTLKPFAPEGDHPKVVMYRIVVGRDTVELKGPINPDPRKP